MFEIKRFGSLLMLSALLSFISPLSAAEIVAGRTLLTKGVVTSDRNTGRVTLKRRSIIFEKDEIRVGKDGRAQFRMSDTAIITLQENSVLRIKKYKFKEGRNDNSALLELLQGGLRTITGAIGKNNKKSYELHTPLATIGIRGTDYEVQIVANGMYIAVWDGVIRTKSHIKNGCDLSLGKSQAFMFVFMDRLGKCKGLNEVPKVFSPIAAEALKAHNQFRKQDKQKPLIWNKDLEKISQEWANKLASSCKMSHHQGQVPFGENLYYYSQSTTVTNAVKAWASEKVFYNYQQNKCQDGKQCYHYTQIVWKGTTDLGCGYQSCSNGAQFWVCTYFPAGNIIGARPF